MIHGVANLTPAILESMIVLLDQDGVLADFELAFREGWVANYPDLPHVAEHDRKVFKLKEEYPPELHGHVEAIYQAPGFFRNLAPVPGALEGVRDLVDAGVDVFICTSPLSRFENCVLEKYEWVEKHLGREFARRVILTTDKTLVRGDILVDDKPEIVGRYTPEWRHVIYDRAYNRNAPGPRMTWANWREVLLASLAPS